MKVEADWAMVVLKPSLAMTRISPWVVAANIELSIGMLWSGQSTASVSQLAPSSALYCTV
jgi:hypothetical protein